MSGWTSVPKPTGISLTWAQATMPWYLALFPWSGGFVPWISVDKPTSLNWTAVPKPLDGGFTLRVGMATGVLGPPTYSLQYTVLGNRWIKVNKPTD